MLKKRMLKLAIVVVSISIIGCLSFFSEEKNTIQTQSIALGEPAQEVYSKNKINHTNVKNSTDKRILLEAAHGEGGDCNHATGHAGGKTYYENLEARDMINMIAGYLDKANIKYEISNELVGDSYFNETYKQGCLPESSECCGLKQGSRAKYGQSITYPHIDSIGADKYLFAFELHFNAAGGKYSMVMLDKVNKPYGEKENNAKKILDAIDSVMGTTNSEVKSDVDGVGENLGAITNLDEIRNIPTYYLETFFMDYQPHMDKYPSVKEDLALAIANALIEIAGGEAVSGSNVKKLGSIEDPFKEYPSLITGGDFTCRAVLMNKETGDLNELGKLLQNIFLIIKIAAPVIAIALSVVDYIKAFFLKNVDVKKANVRTVKRLAIGIAVFLLPFLLELLFNLFGLYDLSTCGIT